jgi:hypothetical protein
MKVKFFELFNYVNRKSSIPTYYLHKVICKNLILLYARIGAAPEPWLEGGPSCNFTKSYNKKKTTIFTTQIQVVYF